MTYTLTGLIKTTDGATVSISLLVRAYSIALGSRTPIGASRTASRSMTHALKSYEITWDAADNEPVNVQFSVHLPDGTFLGETEILTAIPERLNQPVTLTETAVYEEYLAYIATEFGRLKTGLQDKLRDVSLTLLDLSAADILLLAHDFGADNEPFTAANITRLVQSEQLAVAYDLPTAFFYGISALHPNDAMELAAFLAHPDEDLRSMLSRLEDSQVIPSVPREELFPKIASLRAAQTNTTTTLLSGRLLSRTDESPLAGLRVRAFGGEGELAGEDFSNSDGSFFIYHAHPIDSEPSFGLKVFRNEEVVFEVPAYDPENSTLYFDLPPLPDTSPKVETLEPLSGIGAVTVATLQAKGIQSLRDIRQKRAALEDIREDIREKLTGIAELNLLGNLAPEQSQTLLAAGFRNIRGLATADRTEVVAKLGGTLGEREAITTWSHAKNADAIITGIAADIAQSQSPQTNAPNDTGGGSAVPEEFRDLLDLYPERCGCASCENAVSHTAYLTDLLSYALQKVKIGDTPLTFADLTDHFYQPFAELPADCHANHAKIRQVRICVEVLWAHLSDNKLTVDQREYDDQLWAIYEQILEELGTSYFSLRDVRVEDAGTEESALIALLDRLNLPYDEQNPLATHERLYQSPGAITEAWLESTFGWRDTRRPPLEATPAPAWIATSRQERLNADWLRADRTTETFIKARPIVDPDLIGLAYLVDPLQGKVSDLWHDRAQALEAEFNRLKSLRDNAADAAAAFAALLPVEDLEELAPAEEEEQQPKVPTQSLDYLRGIQKLIDEDSPITEAEWNDVFDILVQYHKEQALYAIWRTEEAEQAISLTPAAFQIPASDYSFPPQAPRTLPAWRATRAHLRDWEDLLELRITHRQQQQTELAQALDKTEAARLPELRNLLIDTTAAPGANRPEKGQWLTEHLLIDTQMDACQRTTRMQQAVEALQLLLWSLRTRQLEDTHPDWSLRDEDFDGKWKWLGTYTRWRSAMLVYLFPENVLQPSLRRWQTPVFKELVERTRRNGRFSPRDACEIAEEYARYFEDVSDLEPVASVMTVTNRQIDYCSDSVSRSNGEEVLNYLFAQGKKTNSVYWSRYNNYIDEKGYPQTFWDVVPELENVIEIIGAKTFEISSSERYIYLFVRVAEGIKEILQFIRYDLVRDRWDESGVTELDLPDGAVRFTGVLKQRNLEKDPPQIAVRLANGAIHSRRMDREGADWSGDQWHLILGNSKGEEYDKLLAMLAPNQGGYHGFFLIVKKENKHWYRWYGKEDDGQWREIGDGNWAGGFPWQRSQNIYMLINHSNLTKSYSIELKPFRFNRVAETNPLDFKVNFFNDWLLNISGLSLKGLKFGNTEDNGFDNIFDLFSYSVKDKSFNDTIKFIRNVEDILRNISMAKIKANYGANWEWASSMINRFSDYYDLADVVATLLKAKTKAIKIRWGNEITKQAIALTGIEKLSYSTNPFHASGDARTLVYKKRKTSVFDDVNTGFEPPVLAFSFSIPLDTSGGIYLSTIKKDTSTSFDVSRSVVVAPHKVKSYSISPSLVSKDKNSLVKNIKDAFNKHNSVSEVVRTPLQEAYYYLPVQLGYLLQRNGFFADALDWYNTVYDYSNSDKSKRKIYHGLVAEENFKGGLSRKGNWLLDPLNPHSIAETRANTYTRFTLLRIIRCLLDYANAEFSRDTRESLPRARTLYRTALKLLKEPEVTLQGDYCDLVLSDVSRTVQSQIPSQYRAVWDNIASDLLRIGNRELLANTAQAIAAEVAKNPDTQVALLASRQLVHTAIREQAPARNVAERLQQRNKLMEQAHRELMGVPTVETAIQNTISNTDFTLMDLGSDSPGATETDPTENSAAPHNPVEVNLPTFGFCVPDNPVLFAWQLEANLNLYKLQSCRNIEGLERPLTVTNEALSVDILPFIGASGRITLAEPQAPQPTIYRYRVLLDRARQLANMAQQMEASFLSSLEKRDAELYQLLKAGQDIELAREGVRLNTLKIREAKSGIRLAKLQKERAEIQRNHYQDLLNEGMLALEISALIYLELSLRLPSSVSISSTGVGVTYSPSGMAQTRSNILSTLASFERKKQEWTFAKNLASQDIRISNQQIRLAKDRLRIVNQEHQISELQSDHAKETLDFLVNKFTNADLYDWMSSILEGVYSTFLQQATATAKLAQQQLAFERQEGNLSFIQSDYWESLLSLEDSFAREGERSDRRGLTGSARLLQDITLLDQYALTTDRRKQQLTKVMSLAQLIPEGFHRFRSTGELTFDTPMDWFDQDFPGHYMRQIKRVRVSVIALAPAIDGIKANLTNKGISRVISGEPLFDKKVIESSPETLSLTASINATGQFDFEPQQQNEELRPFEGFGVATSWTFRMPKAANVSLDYSTIADILITLDYTALHSEDYRKWVVQELDDTFSANRVFSFRNDFPDQWYDLHHPELLAEEDRMTVHFDILPDDFPPNLTDVRVKHVTLFLPQDEYYVDMAISLNREGRAYPYNNRMTPEGIASTRQAGNSIGGWGALLGSEPEGTWTLSFPNNSDVREWFAADRFRDIILVITYEGNLTWE